MKLPRQVNNKIRAGVERLLAKGEAPAGTWQHGLNVKGSPTADEVWNAMTAGTTPAALSNMSQAEIMKLHNFLDKAGADPFSLEVLRGMASMYNGIEPKMLHLYSNDAFLDLPQGLQQKIVNSDESLYFETPQDVIEAAGQYMKAVDENLAEVRKAMGNENMSIREVQELAEKNPSNLLTMTDDQFNALQDLMSDVLTPEQLTRHKAILHTGGGPSMTPAIPAQREGVDEAVGQNPITRTPEELAYQAEMDPLLAQNLSALGRDGRSGDQFYQMTSQGLSDSMEQARLRGVQPLDRSVAERTERLAETLNHGMQEGQAPSITDGDLVGIDWGLLNRLVDLPMDEASRMARAREQGYTYGIDEDIWRGVPAGGNMRDAPGLHSSYPGSLQQDDRVIMQWGSTSPDIARSYTQLPYGRDNLNTARMADYSNQDYLTGLDNVRTVEGSVGADIGSAGNTVFRLAGRETPYTYQGQGEMFGELHPESRMTVNEQPWSRVPGSEGYLPEYGGTDQVVNQINHFRQNVWHKEPTGVVFRNIVDPGPNLSWSGDRPSSDVYALPLNRVRNRDLAMFHPLLVNRRNLLAGTAGAAVAPYALGTPYGTQE